MSQAIGQGNVIRESGAADGRPGQFVEVLSACPAEIA